MSDVPWKSLKNGFAIPVLGQGTWRMGGVDTPDTANDDADIAASDAALQPACVISIPPKCMRAVTPKNWWESQ